MCSNLMISLVSCGIGDLLLLLHVRLLGILRCWPSAHQRQQQCCFRGLLQHNRVLFKFVLDLR